MAKDKDLPWFPFYVDDFVSDGKVEAMTTEEVGAYLLLLCKAWKERPVGTVPDDDRILARWTRTTPADWSRIKPNVMIAFTLSTRTKRYHQKRMEQEFARFRRTQKKRSEAAKIAAKTRHCNQSEDQQFTCDSHAQRIASASKSESESESDINTSTKGPPAAAEEKLATLQTWMHQYVQRFGLTWGPPDIPICKRILALLGDRSMDELENYLYDLHSRGRHPKRSYAWFEAVIREWVNADS